MTEPSIALFYHFPSKRVKPLDEQDETCPERSRTVVTLEQVEFSAKQLLSVESSREN